ncbi:hypothetical protein L1987_59866 [Smallanthus sonchifolius]|uniref:Uncharacterized protein n=1 Tax=Smallanthus sonchifolius TaxID=185202 RepID=A0ACB9D6N9_9ASTR|nr:hypothetical protein L1987_59866 [Smallanthus sonchifolius]
MGFPNKWCDWILGILKSASSSVLVNGAPTYNFKCEKGMRQGDPLSPFLFLVVMEALSCMLNRAREEGTIKGIATPNNGPIMTHLLYADDAIVVGEWSKIEVVNIVRILRCFHLCSGLKINIEKSILFGIGVGGEEVGDMAREVGCNSDSLPFKYLGLKVGANMNRINNWQPVYDIFRARIAKWKSHLLSIGGRVVIIRSVLESLPNYYFSLYKAPKKVILDLESMIKKFLWGGSSEERKMHWVDWDRVSCHKKEGGLGLNKLKVVNTSLLAKWGWRYKTEKNNLWKRVIDALHCSRVGWECIPFKKSFNGVWNNIAKLFINTKVGGSPLRNYIKGELGNGKEISFWLDPWLINEPLKQRFPELFRMEVDKKCLVADRVRSQGSESALYWNWKTVLVDPSLLSSFQELQSLLENIQVSEASDRWCWSSNSAGIFSVKAVKRLLNAEFDSENRFIMDWCKWILAKCNIHAWRSEMDKIPTGAALKKRNVQLGDSLCPLCSSVEETSEHIFIACHVASIIWNGISSWCKIPNIFAFSIKDLFGIHKELRASDKKKEAVQGIIMIVCWSIWRARNNVIFSNKAIKVGSIISEVKALSFLWFVNRSKYKELGWSEWCSFMNM